MQARGVGIADGAAAAPHEWPRGAWSQDAADPLLVTHTYWQHQTEHFRHVPCSETSTSATAPVIT